MKNTTANQKKQLKAEKEQIQSFVRLFDSYSNADTAIFLQNNYPNEWKKLRSLIYWWNTKED